MVHDGPESLRGQAANLCHSGDPLQLLLRCGRIEHNLLPRNIPGPLATELHCFFASQDAVEEAGMDGQEKDLVGDSRVIDGVLCQRCRGRRIVHRKSVAAIGKCSFEDCAVSEWPLISSNRAEPSIILYP